MSTSTWTGAVSSDWADPDNWDPVGAPGADSDVTITAGTAVASASIGTVNSITDSSSLRFQSAGTNTVATFLDNSGGLRVDRKGGAGGTILNIAGALTNTGSLAIGNATLSAADEVTAASLDNTGGIHGNRGHIDLTGSSENQALLDVTAGSAGFGDAGVVTGDVRLVGDSAIEFASGEIKSLAAGAQLHINGADAFVEDSAALGSNSALTGLARIHDDSRFDLENKAALSTTGSLSNGGFIGLDLLRGDGGSNLTIAGTLTNVDIGGLRVGNAALSASDTVTATALDNAGSIYLTGDGANFGALDVSKTTTNDGSISIVTDTEQLAGAVGGSGSFSLSTATLQFDSSVSAGQTIHDHASALILEQAQRFAGTITSFGTGDTIDATNFLETATSYNFMENSGSTGGTLTLTDTSQGLTAHILMTGEYSNSSFTLAPDSGTGTLVKFA